MNVSSPYMIHYVHDMKRALAFYQAVFEVDVASESPGWSTLDFGHLTLALHILSPGHDDEAPMPHAGINFLTSKPIEAMQEVIESLGGELLELREPNDFVPVRVAMFRDCEGNGFELRQEVN